MSEQQNIETFNTAAWRLREAKRVVVFTGAGVSAESGIPTFRDDGGFWTEFPPETYATWGGIAMAAAKEPKRLAAFLHAVIAPIADAEPNAAHQAIADIEQYKTVEVITQNIDGLHQRAGSIRVHEIHGTIYEIVSADGRTRRKTLRREQLQKIAERLRSAKEGGMSLARLLAAVSRIAGIGLRGVYRPNIVLFGDALADPAWPNAMNAVEQCDCLLSVGTSGLVMPAAMIPSTARAAGAKVITIDPNEGDGDNWLRGKAGDLLPRLVQQAFH